MSSKYTLLQEVEQVLKEKHGEVRKVTFENTTLYFKKPSRQVASLAISVAQADRLKMVDVIVDNCLLAESDLSAVQIKDDVAICVTLLPTVDAIVGTKVAEVKNL